MSVEVARVEHFVREGRVEQSVVVGVVEDWWLLPGRSCAHVKSAAFVLCVGPRAARGSCSCGRRRALMDYACPGSRGASFTERSLAPKKIDQAQRFGPRTFKRPAPAFFRESSRETWPRRGARPAGRAAISRRAAMPVSRSGDTTDDSEGTLYRLTHPPASSPRRIRGLTRRLRGRRARLANFVSRAQYSL